MRKWMELVLVLAAVAGLVALNRKLEQQIVTEQVSGKGTGQQYKQYTVVLDAGHGGSDPGKVGVGNILEKDVNLALAKALKEKLDGEGVRVVLTREQDEMLAEGSEQRKAQDLKRRVEIINGERPHLAVSIHQNSYLDPSVCGAQVFYYSGSEKSESAALEMQNSLLAIDQKNHRRIKANDSYYLLRKTEVPMIIVECGFLSNPQEAEKLLQEAYREKLAEAMCRGIMEYLHSSFLDL